MERHPFQWHEKRSRAKVLGPITYSEEVAVHPTARVWERWCTLRCDIGLIVTGRYPELAPPTGSA